MKPGRRGEFRAGPWLGLSAGLLLLVAIEPAAAATMVFRTPYEEATFCAGAALSAIPPPSTPTAGPAPLLSAYALHWADRAVAEGGKQGVGADRVDAEVNAQNAAISIAFKTQAAPFYDLAVCDESKPGVLWSIVPGTADGNGVPRSGATSLDRLADDREVHVYQSITGRFRSALANLSAADAFGLDVRILALRHAIAEPNASDLADLWLDLARSFRDRRIGNPVLNQEETVAALKAAVTLMDPSSADGSQAQTQLCFAYFTRLAGDRADNLERAIAACQAALPGLDRAGERETWAGTQQILAGVWHDRQRGDRADHAERAIAADRAALATMSREQDPVAWAMAQNNLATHLTGRRSGERQANVESAIAAYEAAGTVITRDKGEHVWLTLQGSLAARYAERRRGGLSANQERAIIILGQVLSTPTDGSSLHVSANYQLGKVYHRRVVGDRRANAEEAVRLYRLALLGDPLEERWPIYVGSDLGAVLISLGRYDEASDALRIASRAAERLIGLGLNEAQVRDVLSDAREVYTLSAYAAAKAGNPARALELLSAGRARLLFTALSADNLNLAPEEMNELRQLRGEMHRREVELEAGARSDPSRTPPAGPMLDSLENLRKRAVALYAKGTESALAQPPAADAIADGALVAPVVTEFGTEILVATRGNVASYDAPAVTRDAVNSVFSGDVGQRADRSWRAALGDYRNIGPGLKKAQPVLGLGLGGAIRQALLAAGVETGQSVVIMPDGASAVLPLGLALDPVTGRTLIEDYEISFTPSLAALSASKRRVTQANAPSLGLLRPPSDAGLQYAPLEGAMVSAGFATSRRNAWDGAEKDALLSALQSLTYWHFATHGGFYWPDPSQSGILIGEEKKYLRLSDLVDPRRRPGAPRLVVLSACETGLSDVEFNPDEFTGLPAGFIFAGAAGVVASLWKVDDLSTTLLMGKFYDLHLVERQSPARALRAAELWLKDASVKDLTDYVDAKRAAGALNDAGAATIKKGLTRARRKSGRRPFSNAEYWGAFVMYGS